HDEPRRAETAHQRVLVAERLLHGVKLSAGGQAVDAANLLALDFDRERRARVDRAAIDDHRARAARAAIAAALVAGHRFFEMHAQRVEQRRARLDLEPYGLSVDVERHRHGTGADRVDSALRVCAGRFREYSRGGDATRADCFQEVAPAEAGFVFRLL